MIDFPQKIEDEHKRLLELNAAYKQQKDAIITRMLLLMELGDIDENEANDIIGNEGFFARIEDA